PDLLNLAAYTPHPAGPVESITLDHLDTNESPYPLPDKLRAKLAETYQTTLETNRYPDGGHGALKTTIAEYVNGSCGPIGNGTTHKITPQQISVGNGSDELIRSLLIATCLGQPASILAATPTFSMYGILAKTLGVDVVTVGRDPDKDFQVDIEAARKAIADPTGAPVRVVWMVHPNSPTANALTPTELSWLRGIPPEVLVVIDEAYFEFSQQTVVGELAARPNWVVLRTFSKAFRLAAHRMGYAVGHPDLIQALEKVRLPYNLPSFSQAAALTALAHRNELLSAIPELLGDREHLLQALRTLGTFRVWKSDANFIYLRLQDAGAESDQKLAALTAAMKAKGTLIRHTGGGLRITVGSPSENERTLIRLKDVLGQ
ncbi:MAG: histidinol-phosphate transaminase, partial [Cyanobacteria bacterium P01_H01_bin.130]